MSGPATVGWCPGALRPMESGDGLILRVKPRGGRLTLDQAEVIAGLSQRFGNGHLDLTGRANLQIRGARPETLDPLTRGLREAGLLDANVAAEAVRNIVVSPLAGLDATSFDIRPFQATLERCLADPSLHGLPAKWSFVVDGGGRLPLTGVMADMHFRFDHAGTLRVGLDTAWSEPVAGDLDLPRLLNAVAALVAVQPMRMKPLLARHGRDALFAQLNLEPALRPRPEPAPAEAADLFGLSDGIVAFAPPFGGLPASTLSRIAEACRRAGGSDLRLTPWRVPLATGVTDRADLLAAFGRLNLIVDAADPRLRVSACVGAPACHRATTETRADAALLAERLGRDLDGIVHVAGCAKGCARPATAAWTLIAQGGGYQVSHEGDAAPRVTGLSSTEAANWISRAGRPRIS